MEKNYYVYKHTSPNGKIYFGITNDIKRRWQGEGRDYFRSSPAFAEAITKYGWNNIQHEILHSNITKKEAERLEQKYIKEFDTQNREKGYNIAPGGTGGNNKPVTKVKMYSMSGEFIKTFNSASDAAKEVGSNRTNITACCKKRQKSCKGYRWSYDDEELDLSFINNNARSKNNARNRKIIVTNIETNETKKFNNLTEAVNYYPDFTRGGLAYALTNTTETIYLKKYYIKEG